MVSHARRGAAVLMALGAMGLAVLPAQVARAALRTTPGCVLLADLEPSCGVVLGADPTSFGGGNIGERFANFNNASGSTLSAVREYKQPGQRLMPVDRQLAQLPGTLLTVTWKPTRRWADAAGGDVQVDHGIVRMARSIKKLGSTKILLTIYHEPELSVSGGASGCPSSAYKGSAGTPAQYRAMWAHVEAVFAAHHVANVVWAVDYTGYPTFNCMIDDLWPGNTLVDWVLWDPYMSDNYGFQSSVGALYSWLSDTSSPDHDYLAKPWGLGEFGELAKSTATQNGFYSSVKAALDSGEFAKLKLLLAFDNRSHLGDSRVAYNAAGRFDSAELANFATLDQDPLVVEGRESVNGGQSP